MARQFNFVISKSWDKKDRKTIIKNEAVKYGTFEDLVNEIKELSNKIIYSKKSLPFLLTTSRTKSETEDYTFQTDKKYKGNHELLFLDYEGNEISKKQVENKIKNQNIRFISYNSFSSGISELKHRFRVIIPLDRTYLTTEINQIKKELIKMFSFDKKGLDATASFRANSFMFLPALYEGKRRPNITINNGDCLSLESLLIKPKRKVKKNIKIADSDEYNTRFQQNELSKVHDLLRYKREGETNNTLIKAVNRLKYAGFNDDLIIRELSIYETVEHKGKVENLLKTNHVQNIQVDDYYYRYKIVKVQGENWKYDSLDKRYFNEMTGKWIKKPRKSLNISIDNIEIDEFDGVNYKYLFSKLKNKVKVEEVMVLIHFIMLGERVIDEYIKTHNKKDNDKFYYYLGKIRYRKGVYFSHDLLLSLKKEINIEVERVKTENNNKSIIDMFNIKFIKKTKKIKLLNWLLDFHDIINIHKEKVDVQNKYYAWIMFIRPSDTLKKSKTKKYKITTKTAKRLFLKMTKKLKFGVPDKQPVK